MTASVALWDVRRGAWRWEVTRVPYGLCVGAWLFEQAAFELSFDETGLFGRAAGQRTSELFELGDGSIRSPRPGDLRPRVPSAEGVAVADARGLVAVVLQGSTVTLWDLVSGLPVGRADLASLGDEPTAATVLATTGDVVVGTREGPLLRLARSA